LSFRAGPRLPPDHPAARAWAGNRAPGPCGAPPSAATCRRRCDVRPALAWRGLLRESSRPAAPAPRASVAGCPSSRLGGARAAGRLNRPQHAAGVMSNRARIAPAVSWPGPPRLTAGAVAPLPYGVPQRASSPISSGLGASGGTCRSRAAASVIRICIIYILLVKSAGEAGAGRPHHVNRRPSVIGGTTPRATLLRARWPNRPILYRANSCHTR